MKFEHIYNETEENMRLALLSLWTPGNHPMRKAVDELLRREPLITEPVFQSTFGWKHADGVGWRNALNPDVVSRLHIGEKYKPYTHQAESWTTLHEGKSIVVTSGTGSGKTECFMYPVISDLYEQGNINAIQAIFLYPLNALMEDQKKRLTRYCSATGLRFAVYNGDTPEYHADGTDEGEVEIRTRKKIRDDKEEGTRPQILLTNPSMLEYILVRQEDQNMLKQSEGKLRWIIIDEAHSYSGSAAVELAYQIKRILNAFGREASQVRFACTSATIGGDNGDTSLAEFISTITGQPVSQIKVIGGERLVPEIDESKLDAELRSHSLPSVDRVVSLRRKINEVPGMKLQQLWEWLRPKEEYDMQKALRTVDDLCELKVDDKPVMSLRAHFFMRSISGLYACANPNCKGTSSTHYGHLTTYKASVCPDCGAPLLEIVQCKRCGSFVLMGRSDSQSHKISPCEDGINRDDYFALDETPEQEDEDEQNSDGTPDTFFAIPYDKDKFFNPLSNAHADTFNLVHTAKQSVLEVKSDNTGEWLDVRKADGHCYCPECGRLAQGKRLNLKHFRIPINFINQTISPVLLHECATNGHSWGKYIAFTDSRQGTAISAKTFNINVERIQSRERMLQELVKKQNAVSSIDFSRIPKDMWGQIQQLLGNTTHGLSLKEVSDCIFNRALFEHIAGKNNSNDEDAYKAALLRQIIGRKPLYESNAESMGLITLVYPALQKISRPVSLVDYVDDNGIDLSDDDWRDYLKICLDYFFRMGNHVQPLIDGERKYVRDANLSTPVASTADTRTDTDHWPTVNMDSNDNVSLKQSRLVLILCAGLGIHTATDLQTSCNAVSNILLDAWNQLIDKRYELLTKVDTNVRAGYNYLGNNKYQACYYLDLSERSTVCRVGLTDKERICPVTNKLLDTIFCGYSPLIVGEMSPKLFERYHCSDDTLTMPVRPKDNDKVLDWMKTDPQIKVLKDHGLWSDRHKYAYHCTPAYIAAEHSAQQSKDLLREYTAGFSQANPTINVLHCSTTMEMGVDIGDIDVVLMDTIPPTAANYLQRVGRAGRMGQTKAIAFSLCNNTSVGQNTFANPMWALQAASRMSKVAPSLTIIQRHINSYFFREFICGNGAGIQATMTIGDFMNNTCAPFVQYLNNMSTNQKAEQNFHKVFGQKTSYTIGRTIQAILDVQAQYHQVVNDLQTAFQNNKNGKNDAAVAFAISNQLKKVQEENLLIYLSEHQFFPNANMPTGVVTFDFTDLDQTMKLHKYYRELDRLSNELKLATDDTTMPETWQKIYKVRTKINKIRRATSASRDINTALNEYAPEQTVVVNEKNYVSAGVMLFGAYNDQTQTRGIYFCKHCGHTEYKVGLNTGLTCPVCGNPYYGILNTNTGYTRAYEPIGFRTDQSKPCSREERTEKRYYDIRPVLLQVDWTKHNDVNLCEVASSGESGEILYYNAGVGFGFAFCKHCGRAAIETSRLPNNDSLPTVFKGGHDKLWGGKCTANINDIARHVVLTGRHQTCYSVLRFKYDADSHDYANDQVLAYSLGVMLKRALVKYLGIDETEVNFGIKQVLGATVLFIYDTAKGGCGYSLHFTNPVECQEIFDIAREMLSEYTCNCHVDGGACARCLVDRSNYRYADLLSKSVVWDWLNKQKEKAVNLPDEIKAVSPNAKVVYQSMKAIVKQAVTTSDVKSITLVVSDESNNYAVSDWNSVRSEMGKLIKKAVENGKEVALKIEYHPELHTSLAEKLPFIDIQSKFPDCKVDLVKDMGKIKTGIIIVDDNHRLRYFTNEEDALTFSNEWGNHTHLFVDDNDVKFAEEEAPTFDTAPTDVVREGLAEVTGFRICHYFTKVIAKSVLKPIDIDLLTEILYGKHVNISYSDMYVNSALSGLMLVYLIDEMQHLFGFKINLLTLQLDSPKRKCNNENFNDYTPVYKNFPDAKTADYYVDALFNDVLDVDTIHSQMDAKHPRRLKIESDAGIVEIRPDHSISGGWNTKSTYMNYDTLDGNVYVYRHPNEDILYYVIIKKK